jgi:hypothetical protein
MALLNADCDTKQRSAALPQLPGGREIRHADASIDISI